MAYEVPTYLGNPIYNPTNRGVKCPLLTADIRNKSIWEAKISAAQTTRPTANYTNRYCHVINLFWMVQKSEGVSDKLPTLSGQDFRTISSLHVHCASGV